MQAEPEPACTLTGEDFLLMCKRAGIDPVYDEEYVLHAINALEEPLDDGWTMYINPDGKAYYHHGRDDNDDEAETTWVHPHTAACKQAFGDAMAAADARERAEMLAALGDDGAGGASLARGAAGSKGGMRAAGLLAPGVAGGGGAAASDDESESEPLDPDLVVEDSLEEATRHYKGVYGDPATDGVDPRSGAGARYWTVTPGDVGQARRSPRSPFAHTHTHKLAPNIKRCVYKLMGRE